MMLKTRGQQKALNSKVISDWWWWNHHHVKGLLCCPSIPAHLIPSAAKWSHSAISTLGKSKLTPRRWRKKTVCVHTEDLSLCVCVCVRACTHLCLQVLRVWAVFWDSPEYRRLVVHMAELTSTPEGEEVAGSNANATPSGKRGTVEYVWKALFLQIAQPLSTFRQGSQSAAKMRSPWRLCGGKRPSEWTSSRKQEICGDGSRQRYHTASTCHAPKRQPGFHIALGRGCARGGPNLVGSGPRQPSPTISHPFWAQKSPWYS